MPSSIPAAMASAVSGPLAVKTHSFLGLSGTPLARRRRTCPDKLALRLYNESQITVKCVTVGADQTKQQPMSASNARQRASPDRLKSFSRRLSVLSMGERSHFGGERRETLGGERDPGVNGICDEALGFDAFHGFAGRLESGFALEGERGRTVTSVMWYFPSTHSSRPSASLSYLTGVRPRA